jgi:hypothetical protein
MKEETENVRGHPDSSEPELLTSRSRTHAGCNEEATRGAPKDHPPMDEAFKGQATVHRRDFAKIAVQQNENAFVHSRRNPYEKIMGWLLPRAHRGT